MLQPKQFYFVQIWESPMLGDEHVTCSQAIDAVARTRAVMPTVVETSNSL